MSRDSSCSRWSQFVSEASRRWPELSEEDFHACRVDRSKLLATLKRVYGMSASDALQEICAIERSLNHSLCRSIAEFDLDDLWSTAYESR